MNDEMSIVRDFGSKLPVDIIGLIEALGINYIEEPMQSASSGRIDYNSPFCIITVNSNEGPQRRRFTAAHELGHYLLHRDLIDGKVHMDRLYVDGGNDNPNAPLNPPHEVQANKFAADLLMPARELRKRFDPQIDNVRELAELCQVSIAAMKIRLKSIGVRV